MDFDLSLCFVILAACIVIAWPLWAIDESLAAASGRMDRARVKIRVKRYAERAGLDPSGVVASVSDMVRAAEDQGLVINDLEAFYAVRAAVSLSRLDAIPLHDAIDRVARHL